MAILGYVFNPEPVTSNKICAALSVYFFLALLWGVLPLLKRANDD